ncbi:hypothetical protein L3X38_035173 [Prunus dulcis]|uniref:Uncharacterized protein n=1 Tax=Prunus dulcis TaxID=3755 RepID=A0AAD4VJ68_PRUDU|nr:hypothetical protein L3X38_035173 [Prunus dulcis]
MYDHFQLSQENKDNLIHDEPFPFSESLLWIYVYCSRIFSGDNYFTYISVQKRKALAALASTICSFINFIYIQLKERTWVVLTTITMEMETALMMIHCYRVVAAPVI